MAEYRPSLPFSVPMFLFNPTYTTVNGVKKKTLPQSGVQFFGTFKTYGGTERDVNGVFSVEDTSNIETWFNPNIKSDSVIALANGAKYEVIGEPENINMRNQFMKFKVRRYKGGA